MQQRIKFKHNGRDYARLGRKFSPFIFQERYFPGSELSVERAELYEIWERYRTIICAPQICF